MTSSRTLLSLPLALAALLFGGACPNPALCTLEAVSSLDVRVADEAGVAISDATVRAALGDSAAQDCAPNGDGAYSCPFVEQAGAFTVTAEKVGFVTDSATVEVEDGECHVGTARVELALVAAPDAIACCCAFIRPGDFDTMTEEPTASEAECLARDQGSCIDPTGRYTPHACCPNATGERCE